MVTVKISLHAAQYHRHTVMKITIWAIFNLLKKVIGLKPKEKFAKLEHVQKGQNCLKFKMAEFLGRAYYSKRLFFVQLLIRLD